MPLKRELDAVVTQMHDAGISYDEAVRHFKRRYLLAVLTRHKGNQCKAADELGMHRNTLSRTLAELELTKAQIRMGVRRPPSSERPRMLEQPLRVNERVGSFGNGVGAGSPNRVGMQPGVSRTGGVGSAGVGSAGLGSAGLGSTGLGSGVPSKGGQGSADGPAGGQTVRMTRPLR